MKKILGAHNANTYLRPRKWWMRLINFTSKCQKLDIEEQFEHGVRYFDLRIRYDKNVIWQLIKKSSWEHIDSNNRPQPTIVDCFKNYRGYKWIPFPQRYISKHKEHYQEIIDNTKVGNDTIFLCDRVDLFKIK